MTNKLSLLLLCVYFLGACSREVNTYSFDTPDSVAIDESKIVLTRFPIGVKELNDSVMGMVTNIHQIGIYNIHTGENLMNFSTQRVNFDSLIKETYQKFYEGKRIYHYDTLTAGGLSGGNSQVFGFDHWGNSYYIYVNTLADVDYSGDKLQIEKLKQEPQVKALAANVGNFKLIVQDYLEFIFVTDERFNIRGIFPMYLRDTLTSHSCNCNFQSGFAAEGNNIYVPVLCSKFYTGTPVPKGNAAAEVFSVAKLSMSDPIDVDLKLSYNTIDFSDHSANEFLSFREAFKRNNHGLFFCNGKEICHVEQNKKIFEKKYLDKNEWISNYCLNDNGIITFTTYHSFKKINPGEDELLYAPDSISGISARLFDTKNSTWLARQALPNSHEINYVPAKDHILCVEKGKEHYYFKIIPYNEN
jgi:hypothetical protein